MPPKKGTKRKAEDAPAAPAAKRPSRSKTAPPPPPPAPAAKKPTKRVAKPKAAPPKKPAAKGKPAPKAPPKPAPKPAATRKIAPLPASKSKAAPKPATKPTAKPAPKTKTAPKKAPAPKKAVAPAPLKQGTKRKAETAAVPRPKKPRTIINEPSTERLNVYVFGEGGSGELGLGTAKAAIDVKRPRLNPNLNAQNVGATKVVAGGMHVVALTHDSKILTWGVGDNGALGRDVFWEAPMKSIDEPEDSDDDDDDDNGLNPREASPVEVDWSQTHVAEGTRFVDITAGDSCSFALTDDGLVYGWGTFRNNDGKNAFAKNVEIARRPILIERLKNITSIKAGADHCLALAKNGAVFAWGSGEQCQLGRRIIERTKGNGLVPREFGLPKGPKNGIIGIDSGSFHSFAISKNGNVYSWGLNNMGNTGHMENAGVDDATVTNPKIVESLKGKEIVSITGGAHHSIAATKGGDCLVWGRVDGSQMGIPFDDLEELPEKDVIRDDKGKVRIVAIPQKVTAIEGEVTKVAAASDQNIVITKEGKAWAWGFSSNYQTGLGTMEDVEEATMIDNTAIREQKLVESCCGGQYGIVTSRAETMVNGV